MDELDQRIIGLLQVDGRLSNSSISRRLGVSEGTMRRRVSRLIQEDLISIAAVPNIEKLGYTTSAFIGLQVRPGKADDVADTVAGLTEGHYISVTPVAMTLFSGGIGIVGTPGRVPAHQYRGHRRSTAHRGIR